MVYRRSIMKDLMEDRIEKDLKDDGLYDREQMEALQRITVNNINDIREDLVKINGVFNVKDVEWQFGKERTSKCQEYVKKMGSDFDRIQAELTDCMFEGKIAPKEVYDRLAEKTIEFYGNNPYKGLLTEVHNFAKYEMQLFGNRVPKGFEPSMKDKMCAAVSVVLDTRTVLDKISLVPNEINRENAYIGITSGKFQ